MIRRAEREDLPEIRRLVLEYNEKNGFDQASGISLQPDFLDVMIRGFLLDKAKCVFVEVEGASVVGVCSGVIVPWPTDPNSVAAQEFTCFGQDEDSLRAEFDLWAMSLGAKCAMISCFLTTEKERMRRFYGD